MIKLPNTESIVKIVQDFIDETRKRLLGGATLTLTAKAQNELADLNIDYDITIDDIESAILSLTTEDYYRGVDPLGKRTLKFVLFTKK